MEKLSKVSSREKNIKNMGKGQRNTVFKDPYRKIFKLGSRIQTGDQI